MIASLMMYARPELRGSHDRFWAVIRQNLKKFEIVSPLNLSQDADEFYVWKHPELVLSQTCGMPYRLWLHDQVNLVGTPDYGVLGCPAGYYRSAIVVRRDDPREHISQFSEATLAYNQTFSQSGFAAIYQHVKQDEFWFEKRLHTEQHIQSARAVCDGRADIASLDAVTWRLLQQYEGFAEGLRVLDWTEPTPGLPLITAKGRNSDHVFDAVSSAIQMLDPDDRVKLGLKGMAKIHKDKYLTIPNPPGAL